MAMEDDPVPALAILQAEVRHLITSYGEDPLLQDAMHRVLARPGFALHPEARCRAGLLVLQMHRLIAGRSGPAAIRAAAAAEIYMQAAYLFDHLADRDQRPDDGLAAPEEMATAIALLTCAQGAVCEAAFAAGLSGPGLRRVMRWTAACAGGCCAGQFLDAHLEKQPSATTADSLRMTSLKAGSLGRFATGLGAGMATEDPEIIRLCGDFGFNLFTYFQLADDLRDACPSQGAVQDLLQNKKTMPVVFFQNRRAQSNGEVVCSIIPPEPVDGTAAGAWQDFESSGARVFSAIVAEAFLNRAKQNLAAIKNRLGTVGNLERLVSSIEINPEEVLVAR
jgi:geranylgeranyl pyrophosphate synthase